MAAQRIPNAPPEYRSMSMQQILSVIQQALDELDRRGTFAETQTTVGLAGDAEVLPSAPSGYTRAIVSGRQVLIPFYELP